MQYKIKDIVGRAISYLEQSSSCSRLTFYVPVSPMRLLLEQQNEGSAKYMESVDTWRYDSTWQNSLATFDVTAPCFFFFFDLATVSNSSLLLLFIPETCARCCFEIGQGLPRCLRTRHSTFSFFLSTTVVSDCRPVAVPRNQPTTSSSARKARRV